MNRYYDLVLALIPLALLGLGGTLVFVGVGTQLAVSTAGLTAAGLIAHALFVNGPSDAPARSGDASGNTTVSTGPVNAD